MIIGWCALFALPKVYLNNQVGHHDGNDFHYDNDDQNDDDDDDNDDRDIEYVGNDYDDDEDLQQR